MAMPRISARVVCTFGVTIETLLPTSALTRVDLPTFGAPITATNPQRRADEFAAPSLPSGIQALGLESFARHKRRGSRLLSCALGPSRALGGRKLRKLHRNAKFRIVMRTGARDFAID